MSFLFASRGLWSVPAATAMGLAVTAFAVSGTPAAAISSQVKIACKADYFAHCSAHAVGSPGLRQCMRNVGRRLSPGCINALVAAGEVPRTKVANR
jgi:hypothetical protein